MEEAYISHRFREEPEKYFEEKLLAALLDKMLGQVAAPLLQPLVDNYGRRVAERRHSRAEMAGDRQGIVTCYYYSTFYKY